MNHETNTGIKEAEQAVVEKSLAELTQDMENMRSNPDIQRLIEDLARDTNYKLVEDTFDSEEKFMEAAQETLDFRKGKARGEHGGITLSPETTEALNRVIDDFDMKRNTEPMQKDFDVAFIPGAAGFVPAKRLDYLVELMEQGKVDTDVIVMIGCERPIITMETQPHTGRLRSTSNRSEIERAGAAGYNTSGEMALTEFDLMRNTAAVKFDIPDDAWTTVEGTDVDIPKEFHRDFRIAYATTKDGKTVCTISAPMITEEDRYYPDMNMPNDNPRRRANTPDGYAMTAGMLADYFDHIKEKHTDYIPRNATPRALTVTDAVFNQFQGADAINTLAPEGIESETVGFTREHAGLPDWPAGETFYIQEILSTLKSTLKARNALLRIPLS